MSELVVVSGATLVCSQGTSPSVLVALVTMPLPFRVCERNVATILDFLPLANVLPFGVCKVTRLPCIPVPTGPWQPGTTTVNVVDAIILGQKACLNCSVGGIISIAHAGQSTLTIGNLRSFARALAKKLAKVNPAQATATRTPSAEESAEIAALLLVGRYQDAIDKTLEYYGISINNSDGSAAYDNGESANGATNPQQEVVIGPSAVNGVTPGRLAATLIHEAQHVNQISAHGFPTTEQEVAAYEAGGYQAALDASQTLGLTAEQQKWYQDKVNYYYNTLSDANKTKYNSGQYWDLK